ncbi:MAG: Sortilin, neurotensin receptor 3, partial [Pseudomonadota bacterium]
MKRSTPLTLLAVCLLLTGRATLAAPRSEDRRWEDISYGTGETDFTAVAVDPENPRRLFAGAGGSLYLSTDGGLTWNRTLDLRGGR